MKEKQDREAIAVLDFDNFVKELRPLLHKYEYENVVFGANKSTKFIGGFCLEKINTIPSDVMNSAMNAARLYQSVREKIMNIFNDVTRR